MSSGASDLRPLCFVLMPFGTKSDAAGRVVHFDAVYEQLIKPAIHAAGMEAIRADEEMVAGIIHKALFERLVLCEYAVADITMANANVFYELGLRHGVRPWSTVLIYANGSRLAFDVAPFRALAYELDCAGGPARTDADRVDIAKRLVAAREGVADSPVFQLIEGMRGQDIDRKKTDTFRNHVSVADEIKRNLARARGQGRDAVRSMHDTIASGAPIADTDVSVAIDLLLSYRAVAAWSEMIDLIALMSKPVQQTVLVQEQLSFALNRAGRGEEAEDVLRAVLAKHGPSSETLGLLGGVYKDRWARARNEGKLTMARGLLDLAIDAYRRGFEADWRDAYPGINAVTLMELRDPPDPARFELLPVVAYAVRRRVVAATPDYWDHATMLEWSVLASEKLSAATHLAATLAVHSEPWQRESTIRNLRLLRTARVARGEAAEWLEEIENALAND